MHERNWIFVVAFGLAVCLSSLVQSQEQAQSATRASPDSQEQAEPALIWVPVPVVQDEAETQPSETEKAESLQREIDDLSAQQGMHVAAQQMNTMTQRMADYAYLQTWFLGIGTALLFGTLYLTMQANKAAQEGAKAAVGAADAARQTNDTAKEVAAIENRPWLTIREPSLTHIWVVPGGFKGGDRALWIEYSIEIENVGRTPARHVHVSAMIFSIEDKESGEGLGLARAATLQEGDRGLAIAPNERRVFRLNCTVDVSLPPEGTRNTISLEAFIVCGYAIDGTTRRETHRTFFLSQEQGGPFRGGATMAALDLPSIEQGTAEIEFRGHGGDMT